MTKTGYFIICGPTLSNRKYEGYKQDATLLKFLNRQYYRRHAFIKIPRNFPQLFTKLSHFIWQTAARTACHPLPGGGAQTAALTRSGYSERRRRPAPVSPACSDCPRHLTGIRRSRGVDPGRTAGWAVRGRLSPAVPTLSESAGARHRRQTLPTNYRPLEPPATQKIGPDRRFRMAADERTLEGGME